MENSVVVMCHIFYEHWLNEMIQDIKNIGIQQKYLYFTVSCPSFIDRIIKEFPEAKIMVVDNQGMDIGAFLKTVDCWLKDGSPGGLLIKYHSKNLTSWRNSLFYPIIGNLSKIFNILEKDSKAGIICGTREWLYVALPHAEISWPFMKEYYDRFNIKIKDDCKFVGGTIFAVRSQIYKDFFSRVDPLELAKELEMGKAIEPSRTHAWERLLCEIANDYNFYCVDEPIVTGKTKKFVRINYPLEIFTEKKENIKKFKSYY